MTSCSPENSIEISPASIEISPASIEISPASFKVSPFRKKVIILLKDKQKYKQ